MPDTSLLGAFGLTVGSAAVDGAGPTADGSTGAGALTCGFVTTEGTGACAGNGGGGTTTGAATGFVAATGVDGFVDAVGDEPSGCGVDSSGDSATGVVVGPLPVDVTDVAGCVGKPIADDTVFGGDAGGDDDVGGTAGRVATGCVATGFADTEVGGGIGVGTRVDETGGAVNRNDCPTKIRLGSSNWFQRASSR